MRQKICEVLVARADNPDMVVLTGDLGFMALEPLRDKLGERFINCGVSEQNMISVAAAMAKEKLDVWTYTIAPFCYARAFEQIRNDVCQHALPVKMLANGGGYGYGVMGSTHHALEDYGILSTLPGMQIYTPAVNTDIADIVAAAGRLGRPSYIRLGRDERPANLAVPAYAPWRRLMAGEGPVVVTLGSIAGPVFTALSDLGTDLGDARPELWIVSELPVMVGQIPDALARSIAKARRLCVVEEHVKAGGLGAMLCQWLVESAIRLDAYRHLHADNRSALRSGSQEFLRRENGLGRDSIISCVRALSESPS